MPWQEVNERLNKGWRSRIALWWAVFFLAVGLVYVALTVHANQLDGCRRGGESAARQARISRQLGYLEDARAAEHRAHLDCDRAYAWF